MATDAYDKVPVQGVTLNKRTKAAFEAAQARPDGDNDWTIFQGSYNAGGVGASAGTHDGGGAIDVSPFNATQRVHALRAVGFAAYHRPELFDANGNRVWGEHIHAILIGDREAAPLAKLQVKGYLANPPRDGLGPWPFGLDRTWHPKPPVVFDYPAYLKERARLKARAQRAAKALRAAIASLIRARKNTDSTARKAQIQRFIESLRDKH